MKTAEEIKNKFKELFNEVSNSSQYLHAGSKPSGQDRVNNYLTTIELFFEWLDASQSKEESPRWVKLDSEIIEEIEEVLLLQESRIELAHRQQLIGNLYSFYKRVTESKSEITP